MAKSILKEVAIMLLLCVAIVLIIGVIFYDSIPSNKVVPNKLQAYVTSQNVQAEIDEKVTATNKVEVSYEITGSDLSLYRQTNSYQSGKPDPFSESVTTNTAETDGGTQVTNTSTGGSVTNADGSTSADPNSTGTFYDNTGRK